MKADAVHRAAAAFAVLLGEVPLLPLGGQRRDALAADGADRVPEAAAVADRGRRADIHQPQFDAVAQQRVRPASVGGASARACSNGTPAGTEWPSSSRMSRRVCRMPASSSAASLPARPAPAERPAAAVTPAFDAVHGDRHLEPVVLVVRDLGLVHEVHVAHGERAERSGAEQGRGRPGIALPHRLVLDGDLEGRHLFPVLAGRPQEAAGDEAVPVGVDQVAGNVLAQRHAGRAGQVEGERAGVPEGDLGHRLDGPRFETVAGEEAVGRQHVEGVRVVLPLGVAAARTGLPLEPLDQALATAQQSLVFGVESAFPALDLVQPSHLRERPVQPAAQRAGRVVQAGGESVDAAAQRLGGDGRGVGLRPVLGEGGLGFGQQRRAMPADDLGERPEVERLGAHGTAVEEPGRDAARQAAFERGPDPLPLGGVATIAGLLAGKPLEPGEHAGVDVFADHHVVAQVEGGRVDPAGEQLLGFREVGAVVRTRGGSRSDRPPSGGAGRRGPRAASSWPVAAARCASARRPASRCRRRVRASRCRRSSSPRRSRP